MIELMTVDTITTLVAYHGLILEGEATIGVIRGEKEIIHGLEATIEKDTEETTRQ